MNNPVLIAENSETGNVATASTFVDQNGETRTHYKIMVTQSSFTANNGYVNESKRTAFVTLSEQVYNSLESKGLLVDGAIFPLTGKLAVEETLVPHIIKAGSRKGQKQHPKRAGKNGRVITHQGQPVYRNTNFVSDLNTPDVLLASDKFSAEQESEDVTE